LILNAADFVGWNPACWSEAGFRQGATMAPAYLIGARDSAYATFIPIRQFLEDKLSFSAFVRIEKEILVLACFLKFFIL